MVILHLETKTMTRRPPVQVQGDLLLRVTVPDTMIPEPIQATVLMLIAQLLIDQLEAANVQTDQPEVAEDE